MNDAKPARMVPVDLVISDLCRQELQMKLAGSYAHAAGLRDAVVRILRIADSGDPSLEESGDEP